MWFEGTGTGLWFESTGTGLLFVGTGTGLPFLGTPTYHEEEKELLRMCMPLLKSDTSFLTLETPRIYF